MNRKGINVFAWQAQGCRSVADEAAHPFHSSLRNFSLPHVVQQSC
jgi:hypothetical protein